VTDFERFIGVDWSGARSEDEPVSLAIAEATPGSVAALVASPRSRSRKWSRLQAREFLAQRLKPGEPRSLVAIDMAFGLPWGSDRALFGVHGWRALIDAMAKEHALAPAVGAAGSARATAARINARFTDGAPFRTDATRNDARFYRDHGVAYYRQVESLVPQAISAWYLGSGGTVGFHTIAGMYTLSLLLAARDRGELSFRVWPHEGITLAEHGHVLAECYPAAMAAKARAVPTGTSPDERDALGIVGWLLDRAAANTLGRSFALGELPFGRVEGVPWGEQIVFEGWMLGA
jgi:hypothetical protein